MKKNLKIVQINGFRGLFLVIFVVICLIAGFVVFPAFLSMKIWNGLALKTGSVPTINFLQGLLLWGIITLSILLCSKKKFIISFNSKQELSEEEVKEVLSRIKSQTADRNTFVPKEFHKELKDNSQEIRETQLEQKDN